MANRKRTKIETSRSIVALITTVLIFTALIIIPLKITGYGFLPTDDALRHSAKVISEKEWDEILVIRNEFKKESHPGWDAILSAVYRITGWDQNGLVVFSVVSLFLLFCLIPLFFLERPEAWLAALLAISILDISFIHRLFFGRPFIFLMAMVSVICFSWPHLKTKKFPYRTAIFLTILVSLAAWIHQSRYLLMIPIAAFIFAREWRVALRLSIVVICGIFLGVLFTGHPVAALKQTLIHLFLVFDGNVPRHLLARELQPFDGHPMMVLAVCGLIMWRAMRKGWDIKHVANPVFILAVLGWVLGFFAMRGWAEWGMPALLVWMALEFQDFFKEIHSAISWRRVTMVLTLVPVLFLAVTHDGHGRWTRSITTDYLSQEDPKEAEWLLEPGGIIYSNDMSVFYETFFKNPKAPWRYVLGCEQAWMLPEDLAILRKIWWNSGTAESFMPWVEKMEPKDRLIIRTSVSGAPQIANLEWCYAAKNTWIGRLPRSSKRSKPPR